MIISREEFINKYIEKLNHKIRQELEQKLPEQDFFANMIEKTNEITREIVKI